MWKTRTCWHCLDHVMVVNDSMAQTHGTRASAAIVCYWLCSPQEWLYPLLQRSWKGGILFSPCLSVRLWTESCLLCIFNNTHWILFIFSHLIKQLQKVPRVMFVSKFKPLKFWRILKICNFNFVFFWLGIQYDLMVWVIMRRRRVSSESRRSSSPCLINGLVMEVPQSPI